MIVKYPFGVPDIKALINCTATSCEISYVKPLIFTEFFTRPLKFDVDMFASKVNEESVEFSTISFSIQFERVIAESQAVRNGLIFNISFEGRHIDNHP